MTEDFKKGYEQGKKDLLKKQEIISEIQAEFKTKFAHHNTYENTWDMSEMSAEPILKWLKQILEKHL
jgi:hypothetical protein